MSEYIGRHSAPEPFGTENDSPRPQRPRSEPMESLPYQPRRSASAHRRAARAHPTFDTSKVQPKHHLVRNIVVIVVLLAVVGGLVYGGSKLAGMLGGSESKTVTVQPGQEVTVFIPSGSTTREIASILFDAGVIANRNDFIKIVQARNVESALQPGNYYLLTGMTDDDVIDKLLAGPIAAGVMLTVPEGLTIEQTATRVEAALGIPAAEFIAEAHAADHYPEYAFLEGAYNNSLEGYLFPKTYNIALDATASDVIRIMLDQFDLETANLDLTWATEHNLTFAELVATASMIEKETFQPEERPEVASVIYNRLRDGWRLQICATVVFVLGPDSRDFGAEPVNYNDLEIDSPYNTYLIDGLPPGPICSPSLASLQAAASPAATDYYFYVLTSEDGHHTFCATQEEFDEATGVYASTFGLD